MKASVVIPVRNGVNTISQCLLALENQSIPTDEYEIIVVDDGSTDGTATAVQRFGHVTLLSQNPGGPAKARNTGIREANGEWVLFTDADCIPAPNWIDILLQAVQTADADGGKGTYTSKQTGLVARFVQTEYETKYERMRGTERIDFVDTYSAIYRREVLLTVGGFDETLPSTSLEDQELSFRVAEAGYKLIFVPKAVVQHVHADTVAWYARKKVSIGYWKAYILKLHPSKASNDSHTPPTQKSQMVLAYLLLLMLIATLFWPSAWPGAAVVLIAFAVNCLTFISYAWQHDRTVAYVAPFLLLVRALALGLGMAKGIWSFWIMKRAPTS